MDGKIFGHDPQTITLGGEIYELRPFTVRMLNQAAEFARRAAIKEFFATAKEAGLPFDVINAQLREMNKSTNLENLMGPGVVAYVLHLRSGAPLERVEGLPLDELMEASAAIMDDGTGALKEQAAAGEPGRGGTEPGASTAPTV